MTVVVAADLDLALVRECDLGRLRLVQKILVGLRAFQRIAAVRLLEALCHVGDDPVVPVLTSQSIVAVCGQGVES